MTNDIRVPSTDGIEIAVHDMGGTGSALLVSHATGFHGRCYQPFADVLADRVHSIAFDYRGHGDTPRAPGPIDWQRYADDAEAMAAWMADRTGGPIDAFGHSMGGTCLLIAADRNPSLFRRIIAFEPIATPSDVVRPDPQQSPMVIGARRRRATFPSFEAAIANYASKPPLNAFTPAALEAYVNHGFAMGSDGQVHLKCSSDTEAGTFAIGPTPATWDRLSHIRTEVLVVAGRLEPMQPSMMAAPLAERLPNGRYLQLDELDHFGPMTHPAELAAIVADALELSAPIDRTR